jgi:hypothetical protein
VELTPAYEPGFSCQAYRASSRAVAATNILKVHPHVFLHQINEVQSTRPSVLVEPVMPSPRPQMPRPVPAPILEQELDRATMAEVRSRQPVAPIL